MKCVPLFFNCNIISLFSVFRTELIMNTFSTAKYMLFLFDSGLPIKYLLPVAEGFKKLVDERCQVQSLVAEILNICRPKCSEFSVVFLGNLHKYSPGSFRKTPYGGHFTQRPRPLVRQLAEIPQPINQSINHEKYLSFKYLKTENLKIHKMNVLSEI